MRACDVSPVAMFNCNHDLQVDAIMAGKVSVAIRISSCICIVIRICVYLCICTCICDLQVDATYDGWRGSGGGVCIHLFFAPGQVNLQLEGHKHK